MHFMLTFHVTSIFFSLSHIVSLTIVKYLYIEVFHSCVNFGTVRKVYVSRTDFVSLCKWESNIIYMYIVIFFSLLLLLIFFLFRISQYHINRNIYLKKKHTGLLNVNDILRSVANRSDMYIYFEN